MPFGLYITKTRKTYRCPEGESLLQLSRSEANEVGWVTTKVQPPMITFAMKLFGMAIRAQDRDS